MAMEKTSVATVSEVVATVRTRSRAPTAPPVLSSMPNAFGMLIFASVRLFAVISAETAARTGTIQTALASAISSRAASVLRCRRRVMAASRAGARAAAAGPSARAR